MIAGKGVDLKLVPFVQWDVAPHTGIEVSGGELHRGLKRLLRALNATKHIVSDVGEIGGDRVGAAHRFRDGRLREGGCGGQ